MDRGAWWAAVHGVAKSRTRLSVFTFTFHFHALEKEMATHSSVLALVFMDGIRWSTLFLFIDVWIAWGFFPVHLSCSVMSSCLQPHGLQHARLPCPSPTPRVYSNSSPLSRWCHPTISSSVIPFSSHLQSFLSSGSFPMNQLFTSGGQSIGVSVLASVLPMNIQDWSPLGWTGWISLQSKGLSRVFSNTTVKIINSLVLSFLYSPTLTSIHDYWKNHSFE